MLGIQSNTMLVTAINRLESASFLSKEQKDRLLAGPLKTYLRKSILYIATTKLMIETKNPTRQEVSDMNNLVKLIQRASGVEFLTPFRNIKKKYKERINTVPFSLIDKTIEILSDEYCHLEAYQELKKALLIAISTGMRTSEIVNLHYRDICFERKTVEITVAKWSEEGRLFGFGAIMPAYRERVLEIFKLPEGMDANRTVVFPERASHYATKKKTLTGALVNLIKRKNLQKFLIKDLRHTYATYAIRETMNINAVSNHLGHRRLSTTFNYYAKNIVDAVDFGDDHID